MNEKFYVLTLVPACFLWLSIPVFGHETAEHLDPELLTGWRTWLHLTLQWVHLLAFALWMGLTAGTLFLRLEASLDHLLYSSWVLFLVMLATGAYNSEWSAGISDKPSLFLLPVLGKVPYGITYTIALGVKVGLYGLTVLMTLIITVKHLRCRMREAALRKTFLTAGSALGVLMALAAAVVLFYHEVADIWPNEVHSLGGVMGPDGPLGRVESIAGESFPNDFQLLETKDAWIDIGIRWFHLLGFGLWLGGTAMAAVFGSVSPKRFLQYSWTAITIQILSGIANMERWTPFYLSPYFWNSTALAHIRFGASYTVFMTMKHILVLAVIALIASQTYQHLKASRKAQDFVSFRPYLVIETILGLAIAYIMIIVLLLHEGVDHAL
ncbi:MAG: hypothetical protein ACREQ7_19530 [Candidatus Binatia bacterium]